MDLGDADRLLTRAADAEWVATVIVAWASRLNTGPVVAGVAERPQVAAGELAIDERDRKFALDQYSDDHHRIADEPVRVGGDVAADVDVAGGRVSIPGVASSARSRRSP